MNEQFSMLYSIIFLAAIISSFSALKLGINYWSDYEIFLINANELLSSAQMCSYFDAYAISLNFSNNLSVKVNSSTVQVSMNDFYKSFNNSAKIMDADLNSDNFTFEKTLGGLRII